MRATIAVVLLLSAANALADISIDELVRDAGLREGAVAISESPRWQGARKVLLARLAAEEVDALRAQMPDTEFVVVASEADAVKEAGDADAILGLCSERLLAAAPRLVWVQIYWAGAESCLRVPRVASGDVVLTNMQKMSSPTIGEHAIAMTLALARSLPVYAKGMESGAHRELYTADMTMTSLPGKTMLVVGLGGIGTETARRAAALGMRVIGTRNSSREGPPFVDYVGLSDELLELAGQADVIVNALPLTGATRGLLDDAFFDAARKGAYFVNVGRGATVDTDALLAALQDGRIAGAGLDVTDPEPLPVDHPLRFIPNVIITPHVAGRGGERGRHRLLRAENLRRYAAGEALLNVVDPARGY